jgi:hypothetical protein
MTTPQLPWYRKIEEVVAPTEPAANFGLAVILVITAIILWRGHPAVKAAWLVYMVSP